MNADGTLRSLGKPIHMNDHSCFLEYFLFSKKYCIDISRSYLSISILEDALVYVYRDQTLPADGGSIDQILHVDEA